MKQYMWKHCENCIIYDNRVVQMNAFFAFNRGLCYVILPSLAKDLVETQAKSPALFNDISPKDVQI